MAAALPAILPLVLGAGSMAMSGVQAKSAEKSQKKAQQEAQAFATQQQEQAKTYATQQEEQARAYAKQQETEAQAKWQANAFPAPAVVNAAAVENRGALGQQRLGSYQNLASNLAARGFGSGSGLMAQGAGDIESGYLQALGKQGTQMTQFAQTPMFAPPTAYRSPQYTTPGYAPVNTPETSGKGAFGTGSNLLSSAAGLYTAKSLFGDQFKPEIKPIDLYGYGGLYQNF